MLALLGECRTTSQIAYEIEDSVDNIRPNLVRLRHLGIVEPIGIRTDVDEPVPDRVTYFDDLLWTLTEHGRNHNETIPGCYGCRIRELLMLDNAGLVE